MDKIIRTACFFVKEAKDYSEAFVKEISSLLEKHRYFIQTTRVCYANNSKLDSPEGESLTSAGRLSIEAANKFLPTFLQREKTFFILDLSSDEVSNAHVDLLYEIVNKRPGHTFNFAYGCNIPSSSPYFPSSIFEKEGFSIGLQPTNLAKGCSTLGQWQENMRLVWNELNTLLSPFSGFLGIDSSVAPLYEGDGSLIAYIKKMHTSFSASVTTDVYTRLSSFMQTENPHPVGLCGIMFPCLEDFELAREYECGEFSIERNLFLSLHSGLGIDTYPIGIDQPKERVVEILRLVQALSHKYTKPLSVRLVSDGKAKIGEKALFNNPYLYDAIVREL